jgi:transposase
MARFDLSDAEWSLIKPLLPRHVTRRFRRGLFFMWSLRPPLTDATSHCI